MKTIKLIVSGIMIFLGVVATTKVMAEIKDVYVMTPIYQDIKIEDIKTVRTSYYYIDMDDLKVLADLTNDWGYGKMTQDYFNMIFKGGKLMPVDNGNVPVIFVEEYNGWWLWKIVR